MSLAYRFFIRPEDGPRRVFHAYSGAKPKRANGFAAVFGECDPRVSSHDA